MARISDPELLADWMPVWVRYEETGPTVEWCRVPGPFTAPFFVQDVNAAMKLPFNRLFPVATDVEMLARLRAVRASLQPTGFIFHLSRCGSTVITQMLRQIAGTVVVSEAEPISRIHRLRSVNRSVTEEQTIEWLRGMIAALGQPRFGEHRYFIKFDAWDTVDLPLIRRAYPTVPLIFVYRDPIEVMASHRRAISGGIVPAPVEAARIGMDPAAPLELTPEQYWAHSLATWCRVAAECASTGVRLVHYRELPDVVTSLVERYWGVSLGEAEIQEMAGVAQLDPKRPGRRFTSDSEDKRRELPRATHEMVEEIVGPAYARLEELRTAQPSLAS